MRPGPMRLDSRFRHSLLVGLCPWYQSTQSGQTIFISTALADSAQNDIVQPVLQWGVGAPGGGNYWAVSNWYVDPNGKAYYSSLVPVQEGDALVGRVY